MCCGEMCLFLISFRTGSLIFGYIIAVISAIATVICTCLNMYFGIMVMFPYSFGNYPDLIITAITSIIITTGFLIEFLSSFICSVLMLVGFTQNKPALIKTFLIYGMLQVVMVFIFFIILECTTSFFYRGILFLPFGSLGVYVLCLYLVFKAYRPMAESYEIVNPLLNPAMTCGIRSDLRGEVLSPPGV